MSDLLKLAVRCETATKRDQKLNEEIHLATFLERDHWSAVWPDYTGSIDTAMGLVPEGTALDQLGEWMHPLVRENGPWLCILLVGGATLVRCNHAATPALALTAAALRARAEA